MLPEQANNGLESLEGSNIHGEPARLQIIAVDASPALTGAFRCLAYTAEAIRNEAAVTLVLPRANSISPEELLPFADVVYLPMIGLRKKWFNVLLYIPATLWCGWRVYRLASRRSVKIILLNDFYLMQGVVARFAGYSGKLITWVRTNPNQFPSIVRRAWLFLNYRYSDALIAVSDFIVGHLPPVPKLRRIYDAIEEKEPLGLCRPSSGGGTRNIVFVGNYIPGKGQDFAIEAFAKLGDEFNDVQLLFYGGDMGLEKNRSFRRDLEEKADHLGVKPRVHFHGFAKNIETAYAGGVLALNLSESEALSMTCLEASAFGLPVISFRSGGPEEIIVQGETGFLCSLGDVEEVVQRMRELLRDPKLREAMGRAGVAHVRHRFGAQQFHDSLLSVLRTSGSDGSGRRPTH